MSEMRIIIKREFLERVHTRSFVVGTILFPIFMIAMMVLPNVVGSKGSQRRLALVDQAPTGIGDAFMATLTAAPEKEEDNVYVVERVSGWGGGGGNSTASVRASMHASKRKSWTDTWCCRRTCSTATKCSTGLAV